MLSNTTTLVKLWFTLFVFVLITSCNKNSFETSKDAFLFTSTDSLHFDTVFTQTANYYQFVKVFNPYDKPILLSKIALAGGNTSSFKININGVNSTTLTNFELAANDSFYLFVKPFIAANTADTPFLIQDSILLEFNGNSKYIQLSAKGRNAQWLSSSTINQDTTWTSRLPIVITNTITIAKQATLTIEPGCQIFMQGNQRIDVLGKIIAQGTANAPITFKGSRTDKPYSELSGVWKGIRFNASSIGNELNYVSVLNADTAIALYGNNSPVTQATFNQCIINNHSKYGLFTKQATCSLNNCLISNCAQNVMLSGGSTLVNYCTIAAYDNAYVQHQSPCLMINNYDTDRNGYNVQVTINNSIVYGDNGWTLNEIQVDTVANFNSQVLVYNSLLKYNQLPSFVMLTNCLNGQDPMFVNTDYNKGKYNFTLQAGSPAILFGNTNLAYLPIDLLGNNRRTDLVDVGCYKFNP